MSDGTVPVHVEDDATSVTLAEEVARATAEAVAAFDRSNVIYTTWTVVDGNAYKYSSHTSRVKAKRVAGDIKGVVTQEDIVMDFR